MEQKQLYALACGFKLTGNIISITPFGEGHINSTFLITTDKEQYIMQRINNYVFKDIDALMNNISLVTNFIKNKGKETIVLVPSKDDKLYVKYEGEYYRAYIFAKDTICYQEVGDNLSLVDSLGSAFGELHHLLNDLDANKLVETIPNFHNTTKRYLDFLTALHNAEPSKIKEAEKEIAYIKEHKDTYSVITDAIKKGEIKNHVTHNDTKINNVLFDKYTNKYRLVIDLDTVMPGSVLYDIGDAFRGLFTGNNEDNPDISLQKVNMPIYETFVKAYIGKMKNELNEKEVSLIPFSIYLMTIECGMRFLADYLENNIYFATKYETHNLVRARTQIALAEEVLKNIEELKKIAEDIYHA